MTNPQETTNQTTTKISLLPHQIAFKAGEYTVTTKQTIKINKDNLEPKIFKSEINFVVSGERFHLNPQDIHTVFPPANNLGHYGDVFPHIVLKCSTLPWEREAQKEKSEAQEQTEIPWLVLLLFDQEELQVAPESRKIPPVLPLQMIPLKELKQRCDNKPLKLKDLKNNARDPLPTDFESVKEANVKVSFPGVELATWEEDSEKKDSNLVTVVDIQKLLLEKLLPTLKELTNLSHVRQVTVDQQEQQLAVIIGNRLIKKGGFSTACLVSLENRYIKKEQFDYQNAGDQDYIRLIVLKSWSFASIDEKRSFQGLLKNLDVNTLGLSADKTSTLGKYLGAGYVPLSHFVRDGNKTISWYHSPLSPIKKEGDIKSNKNINVADDLIQINLNSSLLDISYAAAWQLGRLLALQDRKFALELYHWKRDRVQSIAKEFQQKQDFHLFHQNQALANSSTVSSKSPQVVEERLKELELLRGVPFNYLVPDERMLPSESIRFFYLDWFWIKCLQDGALSIGSETNPCQKKVITGFLLRSEVVAGWPDLDFLASNCPLPDSQKPLLAQVAGLNRLRMERISENVLLCLFEGEVHTVEAYLKTEALHFGLKADQDKQTIDYKNQELRLINFNKQNISSAKLAFEHIQESERVRFCQQY